MGKFQDTHSNVQLMQMPAKFTILQVENNQANAELVKELISRRIDLKLLTATNGMEGIEMAKKFHPAIILMDLMMPEMSGIEALILLCEGTETSHIPVIILSSNAYSGVHEKCVTAGAFAYLTKPYVIEELFALIDAGLKFVTAAQ